MTPASIVTPSSPPTTLMRFIGSSTSIGIYSISVFGQLIELPSDLVRDAVLGGAAIIPDTLFSTVGFTDQELEQWPDHNGHASFDQNPMTGKQEWTQNAPDSFMDKKKKALLLLHDYRQKLQEDESNLPPAEVPDSFLAQKLEEKKQSKSQASTFFTLPPAPVAPVKPPVETSEV